MPRLQLGWLVGVACALGCSKRSEPMAAFDESADTVLVDASLKSVPVRAVWQLSGSAIGKPFLLALGTAGLAVVDYVGDPELHLVDIARGTIVRSVGRRGQGPGEFQSVLAIASDRTDRTATWIYDPQLSRVTRLFLGEPDPTVHAMTLTLPATPTFMRLTSLSNPARLVGLTDVPTPRYEMVDAQGKVTSEFNGPMLGPIQLDAEQRVKLSADARMCSSPAGDRFAVAYFHAGRIEYFDGTGKLTGIAAVPFASDGSAKLSQQKTLVRSAPRYYYSDCAATDRYVFALFAGRRVTAANASTVNNTNVVHVFDWSGKFLGIIKLEEEAEAVEVDQDAANLYAASSATGTVVRYSLRAALDMLR
ncbi:MAG TPA: BF3164 family lipoprotein [Gemmatimonadales bacterium]